MYVLPAIDLARDAVARQFTYAEAPSDVAAVEVRPSRAPRTRSALAGALHRAAERVAPTECSPAH